MFRRLYLTFPRPEQAQKVVAELEQLGIKRKRMHAIARRDIDISGLPTANDAQRNDLIWLWEKLFWYGNLALFSAALMGALAALYISSITWALAAAALMLATYLLGRHFAVKLPHIHLTEASVPLNNGEVLLLVDIPHSRVHEIEQQICRHHLEAGLCGVGWTLSSAGI